MVSAACFPPVTIPNAFSRGVLRPKGAPICGYEGTMVNASISLEKCCFILTKKARLNGATTKRTRTNLVTLHLCMLLEEHVAAAFHDQLESVQIKCFYSNDHRVNYYEIDAILS